ncbi:AAA family ATPase [Kingella kingae]|uniref:AAA family ATPase n=1 Tax=Kingella kingae TaxID=504 RepID=UPI000258601A|nr:AAA family ATPase [Kingella kingae]EIC13225.1 hypothetical protein KKB_07224 [Kingella kingae PYKK081]MDK4568844.1 AAA family ATPase [Kingella kingae]MDK4570813.1 AAA family ATPase [Kingella kingae]MDK4572717.1 AAA family ATPase [Kingella kingae]MDK4598834.1 AAA family ATPase [Kingella kingae]
MWISKIKLHNFKSYADAEFTFPEPQNGKNLVLIGAENGHGKTTLLEAIYLGLYDADAIVHLNRAGLNSQEHSYPRFINQALFHQAQARRGNHTMSVELEISLRSRDVVHTLKIARKWYFDANRNFSYSADNSREYALWYMRNDQSGKKLIPPSQQRNFFSRFAPPSDYAPFFFFDGEKIVQTAAQSGAGIWLKDALMGLLGITLLNQLKESLSQFRTQNISASASAKVQAALKEAESKLIQAEAILQEEREKQETLLNQINEYTQRRDTLTQTLGGSSSIVHTEDLAKAQKEAEIMQQKFRDTMKEAVLAMPLAFLPQARLDKLDLQLEKEANRLGYESNKDQIGDKVDDFWNKFQNSDKVKEVLGRSAQTILSDELMKDAVRECWNSLFYPLPENCAEQIEHNYLSPSASVDIRNQIRQLSASPLSNIGEILDNISEQERIAQDMASKIAMLKGTGNDELVEELEQVHHALDDLNGKLGGALTKCEQEEKNTHRWQLEVERLRQEAANNSPQHQKSERAKRMEQMIESLANKLLQTKADDLGNIATKLHKNIAHDPRIQRIEVQAGGQLGLYGGNGEKIQAALSAGQMQILIMSLVSALAQVARYHAPMVIDTPLARLDAGHRQGLFNHWTCLPQQVILLSQDTEITTEVRQELAKHICSTYLVRAKSLPTGGAQSHVLANQYFN